ncbi:hypothetical protein BSIN_0701 [Burkholderia singularis]|uniref:Uncharacterized protein n=1 Tax=Burkholderia singularis TaxID=1503053 RepID=A0A238H9G9_9BURK|nr:hypothetical protein BSIN_0701 [Burkholderia singularis]
MRRAFASLRSRPLGALRGCLRLPRRDFVRPPRSVRVARHQQEQALAPISRSHLPAQPALVSRRRRTRTLRP